MVRDGTPLIAGWGGADDFEAAVELECVGVDDLAVEFLAIANASADLPDAVGPQM